MKYAFFAFVNLFLFSSTFSQGFEYINLLNRGVDAANQGDYKKAIAYFSESIKLKPDYDLAYANKGSIHFNMQDYDLAYKEYSNAIMYNPTNSSYYDSRISAAMAMKKYDWAVNDYNTLIAMQPKNHTNVHNLGNLFMEAKRFGEAIKTFTKLIELKPDDTYGYFQRAYSNTELGQLEDAIKDYTKVIEIDPNYKIAFLNRAFCYSKLKDWALAKSDYEALLELDPSNGKIEDNIQYCESMLKRKSPAEKKRLRNYWVVAVGISRYQNPTVMPNLASPARYAYEFQSVMIKNPEIGKLQIPVLADDRATRKNILETVESVFCDSSQVQNNDVIIFYFSGHGKAINNKIGICPFDYYNQQQLITDAEIFTLMQKSKAKYKIYIIESCKSDNEFVGPPQRLDIDKYFSEVNNNETDIVVISSTDLGKSSFEFSDVGGVFSYYLMKGLNGLANADNNNIISTKELYDYLRGNVYIHTNGSQIPYMNKKGYQIDIPIIKTSNK